jgi:hypothetical protein
VCLSVSAVLDGEIVYLGPDGKPKLNDLMRRRGPQHFYAFDLLWLNGRDHRDLPLLEHRRRADSGRSCRPRLHRCCTWTMSSAPAWTCSRPSAGTTWRALSSSGPTRGTRPKSRRGIKIKNRNYGQAEGQAGVVREAATGGTVKLGPNARVPAQIANIVRATALGVEKARHGYSRLPERASSIQALTKMPIPASDAKIVSVPSARPRRRAIIPTPRRTSSSNAMETKVQNLSPRRVAFPPAPRPFPAR